MTTAFKIPLLLFTNEHWTIYEGVYLEISVSERGAQITLQHCLQKKTRGNLFQLPTAGAIA